MPEFVELSPIAHEALSVVLLAADDGDHLEKVVADWVTYLNGLDREYEILLVVRGSIDSTAQRAAALPDRFRRVQVLHHDAREGEGAALRRDWRRRAFRWCATCAATRATSRQSYGKC